MNERISFAHREKSSTLSREFGFENCMSIFMSRTRRTMSKYLGRESYSVLLNLTVEELYSKFLKLNLYTLYPVLDYVLRNLKDESLSEEKKIDIMSCCYMAAFQPNNR